MLVSAAVCPHPPALVPAISQGAAGRLDDLRETCIDVVRRLGAADPDRLVCVGAGSSTACWSSGAGGSLRPWGVDARFGGTDGVLPLSLTIGAYLLAASTIRCDAFQAISRDASAATCRSLGAELATSHERVALLVMGDGSAKLTTESPGYFDGRAEGFDLAVRAALSDADPAALLDLDPQLARDLWADGRASWQVLAGALLVAPPMRGTIEYAGAPLGVGYAVVRLVPA